MAIVRDCIGHTDHSYHHVLWYDNLLIKYLHKKGMFLRVKEGGGGGVKVQSSRSRLGEHLWIRCT